MILFCLGFCATRFLYCTSGAKVSKNLFMAMSSTNNKGVKKPEKKKETTELSNGVVNKG